MTPTSAGAFLTAWTPWPPGLILLVVVVAPYLLWWRRARARGLPWSPGRAVLYLTLGAGTLAYSVCGPLQVMRGETYWVAALQVGVLSCVTPVGLALGDPLRLRARAQGRDDVALPRGPVGLVVRALMFPAVSSVLAVGSVTVVFFTPYLVASVGSTLVETALVVHLVGTGLLFVLPILMSELLPAWASPGVRALLAFVDGLFDAVPGVALLSTDSLLLPRFPGFAPGATGDLLFEQHLGGGALLLVAEIVGLPVLAAVLLEWVRADRTEAAVVDRLADEARSDDDDAPGLWWETDPRFADRRRPTQQP